MKVKVRVEGRPSHTPRARQLAAAFDVPPQEREALEWDGDLPIEAEPWKVGLIVGPSGAGKTTIMRNVFGEPSALDWGDSAVVDDFPASMSIEDVTAACGAVGFNTIPAWLRPFGVLSNGEQFRVTLARTLVESTKDKPIVIDEFTSVVDRQVAQIGAHAAQKWVRRNGRRLVAVTCHYDVEDWLQPDWILEPASMLFRRRHLQPRPALDCSICRVPHSAWGTFAPFHYLTRELHKGAACFVLFVGGQPAAFAGVMHRPTRRAVKTQIKGLSRLVTLPDWQGLGLAFALADRIGAAYSALGFHFHSYPAHPALIRSFDRSGMWELRQRPGNLVNKSASGAAFQDGSNWKQGARPNAVFRYRGDRMPVDEARALLSGANLP